MIEKNCSIEISKEAIFRNDKLNRKPIIEDLSRLIENTNEPFVLSVNAGWGVGKTTFIRLWQSYLENEKNINCIYFSAWENDFSKDPLIPLIGEISKYIDNSIESERKLNQFKDVGIKVLKRGLPAFIKGATSGALDIDKGFEDSVGAITEATSKELIDKYEEDKNIVKEFKSLLIDILNHIDSDKPLVFFIDELDRCRPLYAIELLEKIKHIFGIEKIIFILSIDKKQLSESIKSQYGAIDTDNYLRRFIDLEYNLKNNNINNFISLLFDKTKNLINLKNFTNDYLKHYLKEDIDLLIDIYKLSLREIEQFFLKFNIIIKTIKNYSDIYLIMRIIIFLEISKINKINVDKVEDVLLKNRSKFKDTRYKKGLLYFCFSLIKVVSLNSQDEFIALIEKIRKVENTDIKTALDFLSKDFKNLSKVIEKEEDLKTFIDIFEYHGNYFNFYSGYLEAKEIIDFSNGFKV